MIKITSNTELYTSDGKPVVRIEIKNSSGAYVELSNWGARWLSAFMPDRNGRLANVLVGYESLSDYMTDPYYLGATVGRFANRIGGASFTIGGKMFYLDKNDGENTNHGGTDGFHRKLWQWEELPDGVRFSLDSPDGEGGFPGNVRVIADYRLTEDNELVVRHRAVTDAPTYINLTNHAYFNLSGRMEEKITGHRLQISSRRMLETTPDFIPTGKIVETDGTPFDFFSGKLVGKDLYADNEQLLHNKGYNHCYVLKERVSPEVLQAASLSDAGTGRKLTVKTDLPSVLLYTAGYYVRPDTAVCLETQFYPDTPSHADFPSCLLLPGEEYDHVSSFRFETVEENE